MVTYNPKDWLKLIFQFHKSDTFRMLLPLMVILALFTFAIVFFEINFVESHIKNSTIFHSILGFVLSMLLVFRINSAYDRWWEGRKIWGSIVNNSRNLALKLSVYIPVSDVTLRNNWKVLITNYVFVAKEHLRDDFISEDLESCDALQISDIEKSNHRPNRIAQTMYAEANKMRISNTINMEQMLIINDELKSFTDNIGACERIRNTPIPFAYSLFLKKIIFIYVLTMPFAFSVDFKYWAIPIVILIFYAFASLELISEEIEDPFGKDDNDLPTDDLTKKIKTNVEEIFNSKISS